MIGVKSEIAVAEFQIRSGGRRLISNGPFIESRYPTFLTLSPFSSPAGRL